MHTQSHFPESVAAPADAPDVRSIDSDRADVRSRDELLKEFQSLISEGEALLRSMAGLSGEALAQAREAFRVKLADAKVRAGELSGSMLATGRHVAVAADDYTHDNPWLVVGIAAGLAFVAGAMATRR